MRQSAVNQIAGCAKTYFHPMAKPQAGSRKRVEYAEKEPATGNRTAISPSACTVQYNMMPMTQKAIVSDAGPPVANEEPEPTNSPVPIEPPV